MYLHQVRIKNYRGIKDTVVDLGEVCILIGENNAGKTTFIDSVRNSLSRELLYGERIFGNFDYHLESKDSEPAKAEPIEFTLVFRERYTNEWEMNTRESFQSVLQLDNDGLRYIVLYVTSKFDFAVNEYRTDFEFLNLDGLPTGSVDKSLTLMKLQKLVPIIYISSLRDVDFEFNPNAESWDNVTNRIKLDDRLKHDIEKILTEVNSQIFEGQDSFNFIMNRLADVSEMLPIGHDNPLLVEAFPTKLYKISEGISVSLAAKTGAPIPFAKHGIGTQSIIVLLLYDAYLQSLLNRGLGPNIEPFLIIEEPEAHLHLSAEDAAGSNIKSFKGQKLIASHSGRFLSAFDFKDIVRLCVLNDRIVSFRIDMDELTKNLSAKKKKDMLRQLIFHILQSNPELMMARGWLFLEGESDETIFIKSAEAMGIDLKKKGISIIQISQKNLEYLIRFADQFGIAWFTFVDSDKNGNKFAKSAQKLLNGRKYENHICQHGFKGLEHYLCMREYCHVYEGTIARSKKKFITLSRSDGLKYVDQVLENQISQYKTSNSLQVGEEMKEGGLDAVPKLLQVVINQVCKLAKGAG